MIQPGFRILSLGAGVQSTTLLLLSIRGELPRFDAAIFADTGWEPKAVYAHLEWLKGQAEAAGIPVYILGGRDIRTDALVSFVRGRKTDGRRYVSMPYFTDAEDRGMIKRQCTREYKIDRIELFERRTILGLKPRQRVPRGTMVHQFFGITADEIYRVRSTPDHWREYHYPFVGLPREYLPRQWTRHTCVRWLQRHYPDRLVPRSACIGCPYHSNAEWRNIRDNSPDEWRDAVEFDKAIRNCGGMRGKIYLHRSCKPLDEADLSTAEERGQGNLFQNECTGMCGV